MRITNVSSSSNIKSIGYDDAQQALFVEFLSGAAYRYDSVPKWLYEDFMHSESKGKFFAITIKPAFEGKRVERMPENNIAKQFFYFHDEYAKKLDELQKMPASQAFLLTVVEFRSFLEIAKNTVQELINDAESQK